MTANPHLTPILDDWLKLDNPGFALTVTAPWGAGKSFAVKGWLQDKQYVYVSLFGLDSAKAIEEALFQAALERDGGNTSGKPAQLFSKAADKVAQLAGGALEKATNVTVDLSGLYRASVLSLLPKLIIFDDLERANMPAPQLLSVLNRYVEHQGKSVLLIANQAELERAHTTVTDSTPAAPKSDYRRWREKVVGRTVTVTPETDAALTAFLAALPKGRGKDLLVPRRSLITDVFNLSQTHNLRLLRQSLTDLCGFLNRLPEQYRSQTSLIPGLIGDYLSLAIAWHAGDQLEKADLSSPPNLLRRAVSEINKTEPPPLSALERLQKRYDRLAQVNLTGAFLPFPLAQRLIVEGHATDEDITKLMLAADAFDQKNAPAWRRLCMWRHHSEEDVTAAWETVESELEHQRITDPQVLLHVFATQLDLAGHGLFGLQRAEVVQRAIVSVEALGKSTKLQTQTMLGPARDWMTDDHSQGVDYAQRNSEEFRLIRVALRDAMLQTARLKAPDLASQIIGYLQHQPDHFLKAVFGGDPAQGIPDASQGPLFHATDARLVASDVFALPPDRWAAFLSPFQRRIEEQEYPSRHAAEHPATERDWLLAFREAARALSADSTPLKRAQIHAVLDYQLSFLDAPNP